MHAESRLQVPKIPEDQVIPVTTLYQVLPFLAKEDILTSAAPNRIRATSTKDLVIAVVSIQKV
jgi:hypothetical protein